MIINPISLGPDNDYIRVPEAACDKLIQSGKSVYLSVYMFALSQFYKGKADITNGFIADALHINIIDVVNAFLYCSSQGLVKIHNFLSVEDAEFDVELCFDVKSKVNLSDFKPQYKTGEISKRIAADGKLSQMYKIVSTILGKNLSSADIEVLYSMHDYYRLPPEVIVVMTEYFSGRGITTMRKLEKEAQKWSEAGVDTVAKAKRHIKKREEFLSYAGTVKRIVGAIERKLTTKELEFIGRWQQELKATPEAVKEAYEITINNTGKLSFNYMNKVIEARINEKSKPAPVKKETAKKSRYDFSQLEKKAFMKVTGEGGVKNGV
ncbi:MAG: DnaD domain protein [Clostridia bacterium]|nr:DnaD domain protein [Clostridia bacterium]